MGGTGGVGGTDGTDRAHGSDAAGDDSERLVLRARGVADLLALVSVTLGFEPAESLVAIGVSGRHPGFQARVDLPGRAHVGLVADQLTVAVRSQGCTRVAVVAFSHRVRRAERAVAATAARLRDVGIEVVEALRSDGHRYWSLSCRAEGCCPAAGTPYDPTASTVRAEAVLAGRTVVPDRSALAARYAPVRGAARAASSEALRAAEGEAVRALGLPGPARLRRPNAQLVQAAAPLGAVRVEAVLDSVLTTGRGDRAAVAAAVTDAAAATLAVWCSLVPVRDLAWSRMSRANAGAQLALWTAVCRRVLPPYEPAVLGLTAFAAWLSGDGASAWCVLDRCARADPTYSMASLLRGVLHQCLSPEEWQPIPRDAVLRCCGLPAGGLG